MTITTTKDRLVLRLKEGEMEEGCNIGETVHRHSRHTIMGRDEMNLAEFPLATLADRAPRGCRTLVFEDQIWDRGQCQQVTRRLTVSASDRYGLPTALDDEVILGLVQLSKEQRFSSRCVPFSRYQLIRLLDWRDEGKSYTRLQESLKRWLGVTLYYENAWWDKTSRRWVDAHFHMLDNLVISHRSNRRGRPARRETPFAESSFTWNGIVFRSFQSGHLKKLDMDFYRSLESSAAKRIYRFLDKRFHFSHQWSQNLKRFACEHVGLSRCYDASQLKRRLNPAIRELENAGYLEPLPTERRYCRVRRGDWEVCFIRASRPSPRKTVVRPATELESRLIDRGVTAASAARLVREHSTERVEEKIAVFDELADKRDNRVSRNPAGYLVQSIREDYQPPAGLYRKTTPRSTVKPQSTTATPTTGQNGPRPSSQDGLSQAEEARMREYLATLSPEDRARVEAEAVEIAPPFLAKGYARAIALGSETLTAEYRRCLLEYHLRKALRLGQ